MNALNKDTLCGFLGFPSVSVVKNPPAVQEPLETCIQSLDQNAPLEAGRATHPLQYSCLENPHDQRSLEHYSPWGRKAGGNPLCLEGGSAFLFCSCLRLIGWGPPTEGRAVCLLESIVSNVNLI